MPALPPEEAYVVCVDGEWPLDLLESPAHVTERYRKRALRRGPNQTHIYRVRIEVIEEMTFTEPVPPRLVSKGGAR